VPPLPPPPPPPLPLLAVEAWTEAADPWAALAAAASRLVWGPANALLPATTAAEEDEEEEDNESEDEPTTRA